MGCKVQFGGPSTTMLCGYLCYCVFLNILVECWGINLFISAAFVGREM